MKCHYEVLGVSMDSTQDELKKAYKKLALEWHPDKNLHRLKEATENFQLIQQAYEILIDPQERAWYDRHRDDILRGGAESEYKDDCLDVYQYFNTSCFKGYNDDEKGFYMTYQYVFNKIAAEDAPFMEEEIEIPEFGKSDSPYEDVHNFYAYWQSYCTYKSYSWVDTFDLSEARKSGAGRQITRLMEKENKKLRDQHKKARNEEVRQLVAFVRKRDKRVLAHKKLMEEAKAEKQKRWEEQRIKQRQERKKQLENYQESHWSSMAQFEEHFNEIEANLDDTFGNIAANSEAANAIDDEEYTDLYCIACDKDFRSLKSMKNHENSKKHKENVMLLKMTMEEEEAELQNGSLDLENISSDKEEQLTDSANEENISSEALLEELVKSNSSTTKSKKKKKKNKKIDMENDNEDLSPIDSQLTEMKIEENCNDDVPDEIPNVDSIESPSQSKKVPLSKKKTKKSKPESKEVIPEKDQNEIEAEKPSTICDTCKNNFPSRNKLFEHLKASGHAAYKNDNSKTSGSTKKQKKGRR